MRDVILPDVKSFGELFEIVECDVKKAPPPFVRRGEPVRMRRGTRQESMKIGAYLCFPPCIKGEEFRNGLYVKPTQKCLDAILAHMIMVDRDTTHFNVCVYEDGTALVACSFGLIIGEVWLARVDATTVPDTREPGVPAAISSEGGG